MHLVILAVFIAVMCAVWKHLRSGNGAVARLRWSNTMTVPLPLAIIRAAVTRHLAVRGCALVDTSDDTDVYTRGDRSIASVPCSRDVAWLEVPMFVAAGFGEENGQTVVYLHFESWPPVAFSKAGVQFFKNNASAEFDSVIALLNELVRERTGPSEQAESRNGRHRHRWMPEDDAGAGKQTRLNDASHDADLALLGLERGATLEQVKKAYRVASRKYHPDGLTGRNVEPHLVELAVQRFKEVSAAYQRLCEHFAQPQHA